MSSEANAYIEVLDKNDNVPLTGRELDVLVNVHNGKFAGGDLTPIYILDNDSALGECYVDYAKHGFRCHLNLNMLVNGRVTLK